MKSFTVAQLVKATGGKYFGSEDALNREISFVTSDSRQAAPGALFVAFVGARVDGHSFMAGCIEKGAACCLSEREPAQNEQPCVQVDSTLRAMGALAAWHRSRFEIPVVGNKDPSVTGNFDNRQTGNCIHRRLV